MMDIEKIVAYAIENQVSDIHITEGNPVSFRRHGQLIRQPNLVIGRARIAAILKPDQLKLAAQGVDLDFAAGYGGGRQRINVFQAGGKLAVAIRLLNDTIPSLDALRMPPVLKQLAAEPRGLVLVTGPTGSGKSTTLASMIDYVSQTRDCHIITIEDPVEYLYQENRALIHQREVGRDVESFATALRSALREDPDVILVGEMRDYETIAAAVTAAETGHLVLSTLHTTGAAKTVDRIIDVFPPHAQAQIRAQLAGVLKGVISQQLLPLKPDRAGQIQGRIAAMEIMLGTDAVLNLIREGKAHQLNTVIQSGAALGMQTLDCCLANYVRQELITWEMAQQYADNPGELRRLAAI